MGGSSPISALQAARRLFLEHGYAATTMPTIAAEAGVSVQSVYKAFGNKPALLRTVFDVAIAGDDEPVPMLQRAALGRVRAEPDPRRKLSLYGEFVAEVSPRHVPIQLLARAAAATDPEAANVWDQLRAEQLAGMAQFARALHLEGHLRPDVSEDEPRDLLWARPCRPIPAGWNLPDLTPAAAGALRRLVRAGDA